MFIKRHLESLKDCEFKQQGQVGISVKSWVKDISKVTPNISIRFESIPDKQVSRSDLFGMVSNSQFSDIEISLSILAWGGMRRDHGRTLIQTSESWLPIISKLRKGNQLSRNQAYLLFKNIRDEGKLKGMGPAFYTKLICFLSPANTAFIMDQWTGKSINILLGTELVLLNKLGMVTDENDPNIYDEFCKVIIQLSDELGCEPLEAEERIFSVGWGKGEWRNYVIENYK